MLVKGRISISPTDWSRDGKFIIYQDQDVTNQSDLWALPLSGDRTPVALVRTAGDDSFGQVSPDSRWLAYASSATGRSEVSSRPFRWRGANGRFQPAAGRSRAGDATARNCSTSRLAAS
jgi:hypothetical protein